MKWNIIVCALLVAVTGTGTLVRADGLENADRPVRDKARRCPEPDDRRPPSPSPEGQIDHLTRRLGLSVEQQAEIRALFAKERETTDPLLKKLAEQRNQLQAAMKSATFDEAAIRAIAAGQAGVEAELTVSRARMQSRIKALLTPEQRSLAEKLPPPFRHWHGSRPQGADEAGTGHRPPPPWGGHRQQHPDAGGEEEG